MKNNESKQTTYLDDLITIGVLKHKLDRNRDLNEERALEESHGELRNICAKVPLNVLDSINGITQTLGISKQQFIEAAIYEAIGKYVNRKRELVGDMQL